MSKFKSDKVLPRYLFVAVVLTIIGLAVIGKAGYTMTAKKRDTMRLMVMVIGKSSMASLNAPLNV